MKIMKEEYLKPKQCVLEMKPCELLAVSLGNVDTNLNNDDNEKIILSEEPVEEGFWGR